MQTGVADGQSVSARQDTHAPSVPQSLPACAAQSLLATHSTHADSVVLHTGVLPEHSELVVQPGMQVKMRGLQMGLAAPQSELSRHATHRPLVVKHRGAVVGQSESTAHATHCCVVESQILSGPPQSVAELQPTQTPVAVSQSGASLGHVAEVVQAAWHW